MRNTLLEVSSVGYQDGERFVWETHRVTVNRDDVYGFGIAVSGGVDNPHFASGDPAVAVSDVIRSGPAEGKLQVNDRLLEVNGVSLIGAQHKTAITLLRESGSTTQLVVRRKVVVPLDPDFNPSYKVTLSKKNKKDDFGVVLGCKLYIKQIMDNSIAAQEGTLAEGDIILKINNVSADNVSLADSRKQMEKPHDKLQLLVLRNGPAKGPLKPLSLTELDEPLTSVKEFDAPPPRPPLPSDQYDARTWPRSELRGDPRAADGRGELTFDPRRDQRFDHRGRSDLRLGSPLPIEHDLYTAHSDLGLYSRYADIHPPHGHNSGPRFVSFKKEPRGVGIRVSGGNHTGLFVAAVAPGSPAQQQRLREGDQLLRVNDQELRGKTREEAVLLLLAITEHVNLLVHYGGSAYQRLMASGGSGDSLYVRVHFDYKHPEHGEMVFTRGDVIHVTDTLYGGVVGSYYGAKLNSSNEETEKGVIPNKTRADQLALTIRSQHFESRSLFRRKTRRTKSLNKEHWEDIVFSNNNKLPAYERVVLRPVAFLRPVVIFGPMADVVRDCLVTRRPDRYESPQVEGRREYESRSNIIRMGAIREIMDKRRHCVLDVTPSAVERLAHAQYAPIVIFLQAESKSQVKELRSRWAPGSNKSSRKLFEQAEKIHKLFAYIVTCTVKLTNGDLWYTRVLDAIERAQAAPVWLPELPAEDTLRDDFFFPMSNRLSFASSPESDVELDTNRRWTQQPVTQSPQTAPHNNVLRASSDTNINDDGPSFSEVSPASPYSGDSLRINARSDQPEYTSNLHDDSKLLEKFDPYRFTRTTRTFHPETQNLLMVPGQSRTPEQTGSSPRREPKVVATARGVFDENGGVLESKETGVSIIIPRGALSGQQEIYFKVCQDQALLPPLDKEKGETLLSPLVMCGPQGLTFIHPVQLRLPHSASADPQEWSLALKSSASGGWHSMVPSEGTMGKSSVSVLVDHF